MDNIKRKKLEAASWKVGTVDEFLGLSTPESELIELKLALSRQLKQLRTEKQLTQEDLAKIMESSQSRIANKIPNIGTINLFSRSNLEISLKTCFV
jgi:predicted XRE-type DNA-binding protein